MNRREFMHLLSIGAVSVAAPKLIFDMGKNSCIYTPVFPDDIAMDLLIINNRIKRQIEEIRSISLIDPLFIADDSMGAVGGIWRA